MILLNIVGGALVVLAYWLTIAAGMLIEDQNVKKGVGAVCVVVTLVLWVSGLFVFYTAWTATS